MIGIALGLSAGALFAAGTVLARIGQRYRPQDNGLLMTILVNVIVLGGLSLTVDPPAWSTSGVLSLALGGVLGSVMGRYSSLRAVRLVGATRTSAFMTGSPVVAAIAGWLVLGEEVGVLDGAGGLVVIAGLLALVRARSKPTSVIDGAATVADKGAIRLGFILASAAPVFFGLGFVVKKWGLIRFDEAILGAFIGLTTSLIVVICLDAANGQIGRRIKENLSDIPWWFVGAGVAMSGAVLSQFAAFAYLPAWLVGVLQGTQGIFALGLSLAFVRKEERIDRWVVASVMLVAAGVALIGIQR